MLSVDLLDPLSVPKYVNSLPDPTVIDATDGGRLNLAMRQTEQWLGLVDADNDPLMTKVWGYQWQGSVTYPGPTIEARSGVPVDVQWRNQLPNTHLLPVDTSLHMANPAKQGIATVTHLHGGHTESASDGLPDAWFTQGWRERGSEFVKRVYTYDNDQEAATLWYHDHALGITRLNVYAGLAGFYLLRDDNELNLINHGVLPSGSYEREIVIQDRLFTDEGQLTLPTEPELECPLPNGQPCDPTPNPSAVAEFFGDVIVVNGMAWPELDVARQQYRLRLLNGSDSRFYLLEFRDNYGMSGAPFLQIGTDDGLLENPVALNRLLLAPGERADVVVDFGQFAAGTEVLLRNFGPDEPFKGFNDDGSLSDGQGGTLDPADPQTTGQIMRFSVMGGDVAPPTVDENTMLRPPIQPLISTAENRNLVLFEGLDNYGRLQPLLGTLDEGSLGWFEPITENPTLDSVEVWEIYNTTADAHPIHLHLVSFQILSRESFTGTVEEKHQHQHNGAVGIGGILLASSIVLGDDARPPAPNEDGWKDTVVAMPGEVTRVIAHFDRPGLYVWHCHILSHEDHEMMRPFYVSETPGVIPNHSQTTMDVENISVPTGWRLASGVQIRGIMNAVETNPGMTDVTRRSLHGVASIGVKERSRTRSYEMVWGLDSTPADLGAIDGLFALTEAPWLQY